MEIKADEITAILKQQLADYEKAIDVAEVTLRIDDVADQLLQLRCVRKAAVALALPDELIVAGDGEDTAGARHQCHLAEIGGESREQLLRHPTRAQEPVALRAVRDANGREQLVTHARLSFAHIG